MYQDLIRAELTEAADVLNRFSASIVSVASTVQSTNPTNHHSSFLDVLVEWGYTVGDLSGDVTDRPILPRGFQRIKMATST